ncbi:hypothetical protein B0H11DRAFT_1788644 [Mycena galericulata]|nr:hypothetical protein B0H11DRAFT_1788644 [Mycena galericulata]
MLLLWVLSLLFITSFAAETIHGHVPEDLLCSPFGVCEPCPDDALNEPFCQPFGSRRLMHCVNATAPPPVPLQDSPQAHSHEGETLAWAACGRILAQERADFLEFVACNLLFAAVALFGVFSRSRRMRALQARQLAARIGLGRQE